MIVTEDFYTVEVSFPFGQLDDMITWCRENCKGEWGMGDSDNGYSFHFKNEQDYFMFKIWK